MKKYINRILNPERESECDLNEQFIKSWFMESMKFPDMSSTVINYWGMFQRAEYRKIH